MSAAAHGAVAEIRRLVQAGAGVNGVTYGTSTALDSAVQGHQLAAVKVLLELGADPNGKPNEVTPLMRASLKGDTDIVLALIQGGAKVDLAAPGGRTALMWAAGHPETMEALIKAGAQVNQQTDNGPSPLMAAVWGCNGDAVRELMKAGATLGPNDWKKDRPPQFDDFPVKDIYHGASAAVDLNSNPYAREYRTRLRQAAKCPPDFAGHYTVASWGCGSSCQSFMLIDSRTGKVIDGPGREGATRGADFRPGSRLFIKDPRSEELAYKDDPTVEVAISYYELRDGKFNLIYEQACRVEGDRQKCGCEDLQRLALGK
jgi:hypothetical protein